MRTNSHAPEAPFVAGQRNLLAHLNDRYAHGRKVEADSVGDAIVWAKSTDDVKKLILAFQADQYVQMDFLSDLTAYDNKDGEDGDERFVLVYQFYSLKRHIRVRIKCLLGEIEDAQTITDLYPGANWLEREVYDMYGIKFKGHPNLRRILMDERFSGYPLRKEYPLKQREPFSDNIAFHLGAEATEVAKKESPNE